MIDVIICVTSEKNSISKSLASIAFQSYNNVRAIVIDSTLSNTVKENLDLFSNRIKSVYVKSDKVGNISYLRNIGIKHAEGEYIIFLDENDVLHDVYSLDRLINKGNNADIIKGKAVYSNNVMIKNNIYGVLYKREFINNYNLTFNESLEFDAGFSVIAVFCTTSIANVDDTVYYRTDIDKNDLITYNLNMHYIITEGRKRKCKEEELNKLLYSSLVYNYFEYLKNENQFVLKYAARLYKLYDDSKVNNADKKYIYSQNVISNVIPNITLDEYFKLLKNV